MTKPQESIPAAADVLGTLGTMYVQHRIAGKTKLTLSLSAVGVCKIWHNWRRKNTDGLPGAMLMLWAGCAVPFGVYAIVQNFSIALQIQPQCFGGLTLITWGQTLYYHSKWRAWTATAATIGMAAAFAGTEAILIVTLRIPYAKGIEWPMMMMAIIASVMQCGGLLLPFWELSKRNGRVIGINFMFLTIDYAGAFFSLLALVAQHTFDVLGSTMYIVCMTLETGIFLSQAIWLWRVRHIRHEAKKAGKTYDEYIAQHPTKNMTRSESTETIADIEAAQGHEVSTETLVQPEKIVTNPTHSSHLGRVPMEEKVEVAMDTSPVSVPENAARVPSRE
ncbi:hypothetical protein P280DRAFT_524513 [Massarina eburnea CBS 473.64]|uniref:PQ loop repeat protein n=1 Tax=Massarina eburnea CBS 473.64 TaxID=1395130 RepID=A0A6A6RFZ5_9PLEO|nr:hypothetical protein P280DRAFT_524513 [Massarina eburnea CBS 473.64]